MVGLDLLRGSVKPGWKLVRKFPPNPSTPRGSKLQCANFVKNVLD